MCVVHIDRGAIEKREFQFEHNLAFNGLYTELVCTVTELVLISLAYMYVCLTTLGSSRYSWIYIAKSKWFIRLRHAENKYFIISLGRDKNKWGKTTPNSAIL